MAFSTSPVGSFVPAFSLSLQVGGAGASVPVSRASIVYSIVRSPSLLPRADIVVVSGKSMGGGADVDAMAALGSVKRGDPATVTFSAGTGAGRVIFDGYVTEVAAYRTDSAHGITVSLTHWLSALAGCSAFFAGLDAAFPEDAMRFLTAPAGSGSIGMTVAGMTPPDLDSNIWNMYRETLKMASGIANSASSNNLGTLFDANERGIGTLSRIDGKAVMTGGVQATEIMTTTFAMAAWSSDYGGATLLEKVLTFCEMMHVMLLPGTTRAAIAPEGSLASCQRGAQLTVDTETLAKTVMARNHPIEGCFMYGSGEGVLSGIFGSYNELPVSSFYAKGGTGKGVIISTTAPPWLRGYLQSPQPTFVSTGNGRSGEAPPADDGQEAKRDNDHAVIQAMGDKWCQMQWAVATCAGSISNVEGPLRFDIGPGTQIGIVAGTPDGADSGQVIGLVEGVHLKLDAAAAAVSTVYAISGVRMLADDSGMQQHPLYGDYVQLWPIET